MASYNLQEIMKAFRDFVDVYKPSGTVEEQATEFCERYPKAAPAKLWLVKQKEKEGQQ